MNERRTASSGARGLINYAIQLLIIFVELHYFFVDVVGVTPEYRVKKLAEPNLPMGGELQ
jgi:hypothetical protein